MKRDQFVCVYWFRKTSLGPGSAHWGPYLFMSVASRFGADGNRNQLNSTKPMEREHTTRERGLAPLRPPLSLIDRVPIEREWLWSGQPNQTERNQTQPGYLFR